MVVCAAHPILRVATAEIWHHLPQVPSANPRLAAIHARQRGLREILDSLGRQLNLDPPAGGWTAAALHRLQRLPHLSRGFFWDPNLHYITA